MTATIGGLKTRVLITHGEHDTPVEVGTARGSVSGESRVAETPDDVVWLPTDSGPAEVHRTLGAVHGTPVRVRPAAPMPPTTARGAPGGNPAASENPAGAAVQQGSATGLAGSGRDGAEGSGA